MRGDCLSDDLAKAHHHLVVMTDKSFEEVALIIKASKDLLVSRDVDIDVLSVKGSSVLERNVYAVMFGDYVSLYLAAIRGVDPCNVDPIVDIKGRMRRALPQ